jgi:TRAP transporter 4TM/12TM fusion protein
MSKKHSMEERAEQMLKLEKGELRTGRAFDRYIVGILGVGWALFQLALPRFIILDTVTVRAIHLAFAILLVFLTSPLLKSRTKEIRFLHQYDTVPVLDYVLAVVAALAALYIVLDWAGIAARVGRPITRDVVVSVIAILFLLEATRRSIGIPMVVLAVLFSLYAFFGAYMPDFMAFRGVSLNRYVSQIVLSTEGIYGIPLDVSANTVYLFVLFGALLDTFGAGQFFNDLSVSLLGRYKGGPAKASVVSSGLTGLVSGSSIANVVTTGTFTIPLMKKIGYPAKIAAATEVAASTNGQLMPPIMGAAAFIIAEYLGISYFEVIRAAFLPAFVSYIALFYITHLEASKLGMRGLTREETPVFLEVLKKGFYHLIPLVILIYELAVLRRSPSLAVFNAIVILVALVAVRSVIRSIRAGENPVHGLVHTLYKLGEGMVAGSKNMVSVAMATATAGIIVGVVSLGIGGMIVGIVEVLSMGNFFLMLLITAVVSLLIGMGLPTTATYIVMATITVPIITRLGGGLGIVVPAIAAHLYCFYFGILADDTPPVGLAAYAAAAIAETDPVQTGIQGFIYDLRTAVIPFMFILNSDLLLWGVSGFFPITTIFIGAVLGILAFTNAVQGWFIVKNRWYEVPLFIAVSLICFLPGRTAGLVGIPFEYRYSVYIGAVLLYAGIYALQKLRFQSGGASPAVSV